MMVNLPLPQPPATTTEQQQSEQRSVRMSTLPPPSPPHIIRCCEDWRAFFHRPWTAERIAHVGSNVFIIMGTVTALFFAAWAIKDVTREYIVLTIFIVGGTFFGGGCLLALVNVSWLSRRPGVRVSAIQLICNVVLFLITSYLELLFWPYPVVAYSILFTAGVPMFLLINLPSCFVKQYPDTLFVEGDTVCLDEDALDDATIVDDNDDGTPHKPIAAGNNNNVNTASPGIIGERDDTQQTILDSCDSDLETGDCGVLANARMVDFVAEDGKPMPTTGNGVTNKLASDDDDDINV